ncbi:nuclear fragile X mental retardation protein interacting protein 1 [Mactra antiquata]
MPPPGTNNPWGFQAQNWNSPVTRGPPPQQFNNQIGMNMQHSGFHPNMRPSMNPRLQGPQFGQNFGPNNFYGPQPNNQMQMNCQARPQGLGMNTNNTLFNGPSCGPHRSPRPHVPQMNNWSPRGQGMGGIRPPGQFQRGPRFNKQNEGQKKQKKRRDPGVDGKDCEFYCDICDRGYKDKDKYDLHVGQHVKCPKENCSYVAAEKLVTLHIKLQHKSGLAKKIWSLESKKDIEKWREERKTNFPTAANIAKKKAILAEKIARGEVIEEKYFGKMHGRNDRNKRRNDRGKDKQQTENKMNVRDRMNNMKRKLDEEKKGEEGCSEQKQLKKDNSVNTTQDSLAVFFNGEASDSSSSEDGGENATVTKSSSDKISSTDQTVKAAGALGSLISTYADSDGQSDSEQTTTVQKQAIDNKPINDDNTEGPDEVNKEISDEPNKEKCIDNTKQKQSPEKQSKPDYKHRHRSRQRQKKHDMKAASVMKYDKSLLEKLLAKEIRKERNKIMQCVHYIVKNNFFDK